MSASEATREMAKPVAAVSALDRWGASLQRLPLHVVIIVFCAFGFGVSCALTNFPDCNL